MKIDRQIGILSMLLQKDTLTAPYLAEQFEVSRRTINRDIEDLCKAGIPIVTRQGINGGISIMENYKLDRTLFTHGEMQDILAGLRSLDSVNGTNRYGKLMEIMHRKGRLARFMNVPSIKKSWVDAELAVMFRAIFGERQRIHLFQRKNSNRTYRNGLID